MIPIHRNDVKPGGAAGAPDRGKPAGTDTIIAGKAKEFEAVLLGQMFQLMFQGIREGGPFGGGNTEAQWKDMLAQEYGKAVANAGGIGLATRIEGEIRTAMNAGETGR